MRFTYVVFKSLKGHGVDRRRLRFTVYKFNFAEQVPVGSVIRLHTGL